MALSAESAPHIMTIADFISMLDEEIIRLFLEVVLICDEMGMIGEAKNLHLLNRCRYRCLDRFQM